MLELVTRAHLLALLLLVFLLTPFGLMPDRKEHARAYQAPRSPARPWALEARHIKQYGRRVVAIRVQVVAVAL